MGSSTTRRVSIPVPRSATERLRSQDLAGSLSALAARLEDALSLEVVLYALFFATAAVTRFWDLGSRALHHDESLHAYFSWLYATGHGYTHDPMMHGPFLFHANALVYLLFGSSDYTARIVPALFGTVLVVLPCFLRRQLGRVSMLLASFLLLISPFFWYYSRFIRGDIYAATWTMLVFIGLVRWLYSRNFAWFHLSVVGWTLLFCTKETSFILLFIWATFIGGALLIAHSRASLIWLLVLPVGALLGMKVLPGVFGWASLPAIPFESPNLQKSLTYAGAMLDSLQVWFTLVWLCLWLVGLALLLVRGRVWGQLRGLRDVEAGANPLSLAVASIVRPRWQLPLILVEFAVIAVPLYTSLFTNYPGGLLSGSFGALFYWLAQQKVERGLQPWYYYSVMEPVYEPVALLLGIAGILYGLYWLLRRRRATDRPLTPFQMSYAMLLYWAVMTFVVLSWAGEKMPWLSLHITLPLILLAAVFGTRALGFEEGWQAPVRARRRGTWALMSLAALVMGWMVYRMAGWSLQTAPHGQSPLVYGLVALLLLVLCAAYWLGPRAAGRSLTLLGLGLLTLYMLQSAVQLSYYNGAVPVEQAVYVQTTPRVPNLMRALTTVSEETAGGKTAQIIYDSEVSWPFVWYLRDFRNARFMSDGPGAVPTGDVEFVIVGAENESKVEPYLSNYRSYHYPMRWWFPEDMYRRLVPSEEIKDKGLLRGTLLQARYVLGGVATLHRPERQAMLWRYLMYRRPDGILNSTDMVVFVRKDLVGKYNNGRV